MKELEPDQLETVEEAVTTYTSHREFYEYAKDILTKVRDRKLSWVIADKRICRFAADHCEEAYFAFLDSQLQCTDGTYAAMRVHFVKRIAACYSEEILGKYTESTKDWHKKEKPLDPEVIKLLNKIIFPEPGSVSVVGDSSICKNVQCFTGVCPMVTNDCGCLVMQDRGAAVQLAKKLMGIKDTPAPEALEIDEPMRKFLELVANHPDRVSALRAINRTRGPLCIKVACSKCPMNRSPGKVCLTSKSSPETWGLAQEKARKMLGWPPEPGQNKEAKMNIRDPKIRKFLENVVRSASYSEYRETSGCMEVDCYKDHCLYTGGCPCPGQSAQAEQYHQARVLACQELQLDIEQLKPTDINPPADAFLQQTEADIAEASAVIDGVEAQLNQTKEQNSMSMKTTTIDIQKKTFVNGIDVTTIDDTALMSHIAQAEADIEKLKTIKTKSTKVDSKIKDLQNGIDGLVAILDARK